MPPDRRLAVGLIAGSAAYLFGAFQIGAPEGQYAAVGPRLFPLVIGLGLLTSAVWIGVAATAEVRRSPVRWGAAASSALAFLAYIAALDVVGYLPATAAFATAWQSRVGPRRDRQHRDHRVRLRRVPSAARPPSAGRPLGIVFWLNLATTWSLVSARPSRR